MESINSQIDEELYSRQIICLGMETMEKISGLNILILGLRGLGVEIAKDIIVSGPNKVTLFDPKEVTIEDLGSNFYFSQKDIGKRRDKSCLDKLKELNKYVKVNFLNGSSIQNIIGKINENYNVIIITEIISKIDIILLDELSRKNKISLIYCAICGLSSFIFTDFGTNFTIFDEYCFKKRKFFIKNIEKSEKGLVEIEWNKDKNPFIKDYVLFKDVEGMEEINYTEEKKQVFKIERKDANSFYIGNTLNYSEYKSGGYIEETVLPKNMSYQSFAKTFEDPFTDEYEDVNHRKKFIFLVFKALIEFFDKKGRLPFLHNLTDFEEIKSITKTIFEGLNFENSKSFKKEEIIFDDKIIKNICLSSTAEIPCITSLIGGVVCQEIIKTTGKFRPINQWKIFDFLQYSSIIPEKELNEINFEKVKTRYNEIISVFGEKTFRKIQNLNILLAGAGALGCELLKNLSLFGISNSVLIIDDDNIEISNLNRQVLFREKHKGLNKALVACNSAKEINNDFQCDFLAKRISPENNNIFNESYFDKVNFVLGAIDSQEGNYFLVKQCELYEKIFIKGGTKGPEGKVESFLPNITCSFNDLENTKEEEEKSPSCTRREFPGKIEDCIDNGRDIFDEYFKILIIDFLKIFEDKNDSLKFDIENSMGHFNLINKIINLIRINFNQINKNLNEKNEIKNNLEKELFKFGLEEFNERFTEDIKIIKAKHPIDNDEESINFWKNKRIPLEIKFNIDEDLSFNYLFYFINIFSKMLNIELNSLKDKSIFKEKLNEILIELNNNNTTYDKITEPTILYNKIIEGINDIKNYPNYISEIKKINPVNFEKDIPSNGHMKFIHSFANIKAKSYKIPCCDKFYTLEYAGKIAPTTITSTAVVGGYICLQMIGILINQIYFSHKIRNITDDFENIDDEELIETGLHNLYFNLKTNDFIFEPLYKEKFNGIWKVNNLVPEKYSRWYKIDEKINQTLMEFIQYIKEKYGIDITLILTSINDKPIYEKMRIPKKIKNKKFLEKQKKFEESLHRQISDIYFESIQKVCKDYNENNTIFINVKGFAQNNEYSELPVIKIIK